MEFVKIADLVADREYNMLLSFLRVPRDEGCRIKETQIHKLGLALTGVNVPINPNRIQILGATEEIYLDQLAPERRREVAELLVRRGVKCIVITRNIVPPAEFAESFEKGDIGVLTTPLKSDVFIERATNFLMSRLAPRKSIHGVLVDVLGVGVLILGKGGIGKSECALALVSRGHRLVADDSVQLVKWRDSIIGHFSPDIQHHMEIRGLGIINIKDLYGIAAVRDKKKVDMVIELVEWSPHLKLDTFGVDELKYTVLDTDLPFITLPILPGKSISAIVEVAARNQLLKIEGHDSAREFMRTKQESCDEPKKPIAKFGEEVE